MPIRVRSLLFAAATRPDHVAKLGRAAPDIAVIDLEDAVAPDAKEMARKLAREGAAALVAESPDLSVFVRVNALGNGSLDADVNEGLVPELTGVLLPKMEHPNQIRRLRRTLDAAGLASLVIIGGIESASGVENATALAASGIVAVYFGAEDFVTDVGGRRTEAGLEVLYARSQVVLAARRAGIPAIDQAVIDPTDDERVAREVADGLDLGYAGKLCIHPRQVAVVHATLRPTENERADAERILQASVAAQEHGQGVSVVDGIMVDRPTILRAQAVLARTGATTTAGPARATKPERTVAGRYFDELAVGDLIPHAVTRTITEADNVLFSCLTMNAQPLHLDAAYAEETEFGERLVNSMFTIALVVGLSVYELTLGTVVANLGFSHIETPRPLFHGDTVRAESEVLSARPSNSRPTAGIVEFEHRAYNQHDDVIAVIRRRVMMQRCHTSA